VATILDQAKIPFRRIWSTSLSTTPDPGKNLAGKQVGGFSDNPAELHAL